MTLLDFEQQIFATALASKICDIPSVARLTATAIKLQIQTTVSSILMSFIMSRPARQPMRSLIKGNVSLVLTIQAVGINIPFMRLLPMIR